MQSRVRLAFFWILPFAHLFFSHQCLSSESPTPCETPIFYTSRCPFEVDLTLALDDFRSLPEGSWNGNWGAYAAVNLKAFLPYCLTTQLAGSYGLYDWAGRAFAPFIDPDSLQQQGFITVAASRQVPCSGINAGIAYDWMLNSNFGVFAVNPFFDQIRGQIGYLIEGANEVGLWAAYGIRISNQESQQVPLQFRGISQVNLFWCHYFQNNGYAMLWAGTPYRRGLMYESGRPGTYIFGLQFSVPVADFLNIEGHGAYMGPRGGSGLMPAKNYASNLSIGLTYSFGKRMIKQSPYMTLSNNSNFMVDTNQNL